MYLGSYADGSVHLNKITDLYVYHKDNNAECYFIGEVLSSKEETYSAFQKFIREPKPEHVLFLQGNYQVIIHISNQLWLFSDLGNVRPIFYMKYLSQWLFSSHLSLLHQQINSSLHFPWFRRMLSTSGFHIETETPFKGINQIPGAFGVSINKCDFKLFQTWIVDQESNLSAKEAQIQLKEELTNAVLLRCEGKRITTDLSGGLDSSTITWIASKQNSVRSVTIIGKEENEDIQVAREIVKVRDNISHTEFTQKDIPLIYSNMDQIKTDIPIPFYWSANKVKKKFQWAKKNGSDIHFSGEGGDTVLGADFTYLVDLLKQGKWKTFISHTRGWAQLKKQSPWSWLSGSVCGALGIPYNSHQRHPLASIQNQADWYLFSSSVFDKGRYSRKLGVSNTLHGIHYLGYISHGLKNLAEQESLNISFPYLDNRVIRTCMRLPSEYKMHPCRLKPIIKEAFRQDLPHSLLERNTKGDYTTDVYYGMKQNLDWFHHYFRKLQLEEMNLIDGDKFRECFERLAVGAPVKLPEFHLTLSLEMWLSMMEGGKSCD